MWSGCTFLDWPGWWSSQLWTHRRYIVSVLVSFISLHYMWPHHLCSMLMHYGTLSISAGFICPFVPLLPISCVLINVYLLINLGWVSNQFHAVLVFKCFIRVLFLSCFFGCICWENYRVLRCNKCLVWWGPGFPACWGSMIGWSRPLIIQPPFNWWGAKKPLHFGRSQSAIFVAFLVLGPL